MNRCSKWGQDLNQRCLFKGAQIKLFHTLVFSHHHKDNMGLATLEVRSHHRAALEVMLTHRPSSQRHGVRKHNRRQRERLGLLLHSRILSR